MRGRLVWLTLLCAYAGGSSGAQDFKVFDRTVQVHGFAAQGFVHTDGNNWLTMYSNGVGSGEFTDFGVNAAIQVNDRLRVGAQLFDRNLGHLGAWSPSLDWAFADYRFKNWFGLRGGKVKTVLGLYNDSQDLDFVRTFALLPQSVYPTDVRDSTISHLGGDFYGSIALPHHMGTLSYTAYAGLRKDNENSGYPYLLSQFQTRFTTFGGLQYGGDVRWATPIMGLLVGASRLNQDTDGSGSSVIPANPSAGRIPYSECSKADWTNQFYGQYSRLKWEFDAEYRRYLRNQAIFGGISTNITDVRAWYVSGTYHLAKRISVASYYSHYAITSVVGGALLEMGVPQQVDTSLPENHIYDKTISGRVDLTKFWNVKVEGHFMDGYGNGTYPNGFYPQVNPEGFKPNTNGLVVRTSMYF